MKRDIFVVVVVVVVENNISFVVCTRLDFSLFVICMFVVVVVVVVVVNISTLFSNQNVIKFTSSFFLVRFFIL